MKKILIVDDNPDNVLLLDKILSREGYETLKAYTGKDGLDLAVREIPDLILLDVMMPDMDGITVCRELTSTDRTNNIPVILVTAKTAPEETNEGFLAGAMDYIKKPFDRVDLLARINSAIKTKENQKLKLEYEKMKMFAATVLTANHEIKQPLTLISLSSSAIKRELAKESVSKEAVINKIASIEGAIKDIANILEKMNEIKTPSIANYSKDIQLIELKK
ncbi:MAG TPA: response regulator [Ignavibacteriales bacterium]|nr:response regulator [Ignavibacteriales bacterium]